MVSVPGGFGAGKKRGKKSLGYAGEIGKMGKWGKMGKRCMVY